MDIVEDDDPWLDEEATGPDVLQRNTKQDWERLSTKFSDAGYREGITAGQQSTLQAGFDQGYSEKGVPLGRELGYLRGVAASLLSYLGTTTANANAPESAQASDLTRQELTERARDVVRNLGKFRIVDLAGPDKEAEEHAREHGEEVVIPQKLQDQRDMDSLEDSLDALAGRLGGKTSADTNPPGRSAGDGSTIPYEKLQLQRKELELLLEACHLKVPLN